MGVKKKHDHESEWIQHYRNQPTRSIPAAQQINGDANYLNGQMGLLDISRDASTHNKNYDHYLSKYDSENMNSVSESKNKQNSRGRTNRNQVESSSNAVQQTIVISDEEDDDEDTTYPNNTHSQTNDGKKKLVISSSLYGYSKIFVLTGNLCMTKSNGKHSKRDSDEIVDITDDDDVANEEDGDEEER